MRRLFRNLLGIIGLIFGFFAGYYFLPAVKAFGMELSYVQTIGVVAGAAVIGGLTGLIVAPLAITGLMSLTAWIDLRLTRLPSQDIVSGVLGLIVGLLIAALLSPALSIIPVFGRFLPVLFSVVLGYLGLTIAVKKREEWSGSGGVFPRRSRDRRTHSGNAQPKVLDTSVIIDGRIADVCRSGFIEGNLIVPRFVLEELRHIADSSDALKRNRGRRGLDILNRIQQEQETKVQITDRDFSDVEVDSKLIQLAQAIDAKIITNDFNLNKVAQLEGVSVLNINELANSVKPVVLPGEDMVVHIIKDGKEMGQGVGYLDDGTMIVVDGGKKHIGETIGVSVTSVLQTAAGRMIFARLRCNDRSAATPGGR